MPVSRNYEQELDMLKDEVSEIKQLLRKFLKDENTPDAPPSASAQSNHVDYDDSDRHIGAIYYSGQYNGQKGFRWDPQKRPVDQLLELDSDKAAKILAALGNKQRLDILISVLQGPKTGIELVDQLHMGTTGQLYHHTKALTGADMLVQEERGGRYSLPAHRTLPLLLLLAACSDLLDASHYIELAEARNDAADYLGHSEKGYDPHHLLWAVLQNSILEHEAGFSSEISIVLQKDGSVTVSDNGRGIPVQAFPNSSRTPVQAVLTELSHYNQSASVSAPGGRKGITMPIVNALSERLSVEVKREGKVFRQDFKHGIPQSELLTIGLTKETGTSVTFLPDSDIFQSVLDNVAIKQRIMELQSSYSKLNFEFLF